MQNRKNHSTVYRARRSLARWIAPQDEVFSRDVSLDNDRLRVENEELKKQLAEARPK